MKMTLYPFLKAHYNGFYEECRFIIENVLLVLHVALVEAPLPTPEVDVFETSRDAVPGVRHSCLPK